MKLLKVKPKHLDHPLVVGFSITYKPLLHYLFLGLAGFLSAKVVYASVCSNVLIFLFVCLFNVKKV